MQQLEADEADLVVNFLDRCLRCFVAGLPWPRGITQQGETIAFRCCGQGF